MWYVAVGIGGLVVGGAATLGWVIYQMERDNPERIKEQLARKQSKRK